MIKVLHLIHSLGLGGAARGMLATAKYSSLQGEYLHRIVSLTPADPKAVVLAVEAGIDVVNAPDRAVLELELAWADIVQLSWWNDPEVYDWLRSSLPPMRLMIWPHVAGDGSPQIITKQLVDFADFVVASSPYTHDRPVFRNLPEGERLDKVALVYDATDFARVQPLESIPHVGFNVGYIGTVDFVKMHPRFVPMSAAVEIPDIRFIVCGQGIEKQLRNEAQHLGAAERFDFRGYVDDIRPILKVLDVYGYPLCEGNYASAELNLQEVMVVGIPPVVFPYGGVGRLVVNEYTGLVVQSEREYKQAIEYLYHHPEERTRLGRNAQEYARQIFGAENAARRLNPVYERMMRTPKRERFWGARAGESILYAEVTFADLIEPQSSGAAQFIESLGAWGGDFHVSRYSSDMDKVLAAEKRIMAASPLLRSEWSGGIVHYRKHNPQDPWLWLWSALTKLGQGAYELALQEFERTKNLGLNHWRLDGYLAQAAYRLGDGSLAESALERLPESGSNFLDILLLKADLLMEKGLREEGFAILERANRLHPDSAEVWKRLGFFHHVAGDSGEAERSLRRALSFAPQDPDLLFSLGDLCLGRRDIRQALGYFRAVTDASPLDAEAWNATASAALQLGEQSVYEDALKQLERLDPERAQV